MDNNALVPDSFPADLTPIEEIDSQQITAAVEVDREIGSLLGSKGWQRITEDMKTDIDKLRHMTATELSGLNMAEVGEKFLVSSLVADHLQKYLDKVENAAKAIADAERANQPN